MNAPTLRVGKPVGRHGAGGCAFEHSASIEEGSTLFAGNTSGEDFTPILRFLLFNSCRVVVASWPVL